jgi:hypothetical protein
MRCNPFFGDAAEQLPAAPDNQEASNPPESSKWSHSRSIQARTAQQWLKKLGQEWGTVRMGVMWMTMSERM